VGIWLDHPLWLLLAALALPLGWVGWRVFRLGMSRLRVYSALGARLLLLLAIALALAGAAAVRDTDRMAVVVVVDNSVSVQQLAARFAEFDAAAGDGSSGSGAGGLSEGETTSLQGRVAAFLSALADAREPDDLLGVVLFDDQPTAAIAPTARPGLDVNVFAPPGDATNIAEALRFADSITPAGVRRRIVLISDGAQTKGDALDAARALGASADRPTPVDIVPIGYRVRGEVLVETIDLPPQTTRGATVAARVVLRATEPAEGEIELLYNGEILDLNGDAPGLGRAVSLQPGRNVVTLEVPLAERLVSHRLEAVYRPFVPARGAVGEADAAGTAVDAEGGVSEARAESGAPAGASRAAARTDTITTNNRAEALTVTRGAGVVLLLDGRFDSLEAPNALQAVLEAANMTVERRLPSDAPTDLLELQGYDLVVMQDVGSWEISQAARDRLVDHVSLMGGGLVMVGGEDSFGAGGWLDSEIADVLPVRLDLPDEVLISQAAVAIVLDSSGSMNRPVMGGQTRQQDVANAGAAEAIRSLDENDMLMVVSFASSPRVVVPMGANVNKEANAAEVEGILSGGGTRILPAVRLAGGELMGVEANVKHMILLTDGRAEGEDPSELIAYAERLADAGVSLTTIAVGGDVDAETLRRAAVAGDGVFYRVSDPRTLPAIFLKEVNVVRRPLIREEPFNVAVTGPGSPTVLGVEGFRAGDVAPPLRGLVLTRQRDEPTITYALASEDGYPLLAHWFVGRGQVAAFTSDASAAGWAEPWVDAAGGAWPGYTTLWPQIVRVIARPPVETGAELSTDIVDDELRIRYDALTDEGEPIDRLTVDGTVTGPDGETRRVTLVQTGPGRYEAALPADERGNYVVALSRRAGTGSVSGGGGGGAGEAGARREGVVIGSATKAVGPEQRQLSSNLSLLDAIREATGGRVLDLSSASATAAFDRAGVQPARTATPLWPVLVAVALVLLVADVGTRRVAWDRLLTREVVADMQRHTAGAVAERAKAAAGTVGGLRSRMTTREREVTPEGEPTPASGGAGAADRGGLAAAARAARAQPAPAERVGEEDDPDAAARAKKILERQAAKKEQARKAALAELSGKKPGSASSAAADGSSAKPNRAAKSAKADKGGDGESDAAPTEGLLAAKRRAAERRKGREV